MTVEEKANQIMDKYLTEFEIFGVRTAFNNKKYESAKKCALICVDEMIKEYDTKILSGRPSRLEARKHFWEKVKESINNAKTDVNL